MGAAVLRPRIFTLSKGATTVQATRKRACKRCEIEIVYILTG